MVSSILWIHCSHKSFSSFLSLPFLTKCFLSIEHKMKNSFLRERRKTASLRYRRSYEREMAASLTYKPKLTTKHEIPCTLIFLEYTTLVFNILSVQWKQFHTERVVPLVQVEVVLEARLIYRLEARRSLWSHF